MKWINIKDAKPELGQLVVVNFKDNFKHIYVYVKDIDGKNEFINGGVVARKENVTHWLALPDFVSE